ncbi:MAG TPA: hypothetical protein V6C96_04330 [Vampirovibrionales bacterium]
MSAFKVCVTDKISKEEIMSVPCAEEVTAQLVEKNLASLFPNATIHSAQVQTPSQPEIKDLRSTNKIAELSNKYRKVKQSKLTNVDFAELEEDLFAIAA